MALICPPKEDSERRREVLCKLKGVVDKLTEDEGPVPFHICPPPCCPPCCTPCCRPCCPPCCPPSSPAEEVFCKPPEVMVCYRVKKCTKGADKEAKAKTKKEAEGSKVKQSKSRELRAGILYIGCDCEKRNGLQDDCQRSECRGSPACLTKPKPTCGPSEFSNGKHLGKKSYSLGANGEGGGNGNGGDQGGDRGGKQEMGEYECFPAVLDTSHTCPCTS